MNNTLRKLSQEDILRHLVHVSGVTQYKEPLEEVSGQSERDAILRRPGGLPGGS